MRSPGGANNIVHAFTSSRRHADIRKAIANVDDLKGRQELYNGFGDTLARGFELAVMPLLFGGIGYVLDRIFGLTPLLTILFAAFCIVGMSVRMYYAYDSAMRAHDDAAPWARREPPASQGAPGPRMSLSSSPAPLDRRGSR